jgi:hypothetical protein
MNNLISPTSSHVVADLLSGDSMNDGDMLLRVMPENNFKTITITSVSTQTVVDGLNTYLAQHLQNTELLCSVIYWQKRTIDYQALYAAFLLDSLSEEDFEQEAEKFTIHQKRILPEKIAFDIEQLDSLIGIKFDTSDYSDYFQCSQENVMEGLRLLPSKHFSAMLPASIEDS